MLYWKIVYFVLKSAFCIWNTYEAYSLNMKIALSAYKDTHALVYNADG